MGEVPKMDFNDIVFFMGCLLYPKQMKKTSFKEQNTDIKQVVDKRIKDPLF
jgi:hypothetical protein